MRNHDHDRSVGARPAQLRVEEKIERHPEPNHRPEEPEHQRQQEGDEMQTMAQTQDAPDTGHPSRHAVHFGDGCGIHGRSR
jgi:hypothetical protein